MKRKKNHLRRIYGLTATFLASAMVLAGSFRSEAEVIYMDHVTSEMTKASYWYSKVENPDEVLADISEIESINADIVAGSGTGVGDIRNVADTIDGVALNTQLEKSAISDVDYFLSQAATMYTDGGAVLTKDSFADVIENTQNPNATSEQAVMYGVVTTRTTLNALPTDMMVLDEQWDYNFDYIHLSALLMNEPVVIRSISADGLYYYAVTTHSRGWVKVSDVAVCKDKEEWLYAWDIEPENVLVVYGDKVTTEETRVDPEISKIVLPMGTILRLAEQKDWTKVISNRSSYYNHVVWMPTRKDDGTYEKKLCLISQHTKTSEGYLPLTYKNIADVAFNMLGNTYGWGGMLSSNDCSGYVRDVYRCFGFNLGRNTNNQMSQPVKKYDVSTFTKEEKETLLKNLPIGSVLLWGAHEMIYLGHEDGYFYVINSVSSATRPDGQGTRIRNVIINTIDITRPNGQTWLDTVTTMEIPYIGVNSPGYDYDYTIDREKEAAQNSLDESIKGAKEFYESIKSDSAYSEIAEELKSAIEEAVKASEDAELGTEELITADTALQEAFEKVKAEKAAIDEEKEKKDDPDDKKDDPEKKDDDKKDDKPAEPAHKSEWIDGQWYDEAGKTDYAAKGSWKQNETGWWFEDSSGWYPVSSWQKIDGLWYYFRAEGYMAASEWIDDYWLDSDGACRYVPRGGWRRNKAGWWYEDTSGWQPVSQWLSINERWYYFGDNGNLVTSSYVDGYWVNADGACE